MNTKLIQALTDARGALYLSHGIMLAGIRGDASLTEDVIDEELRMLDDHIDALRKV